MQTSTGIRRVNPRFHTVVVKNVGLARTFLISITNKHVLQAENDVRQRKGGKYVCMLEKMAFLMGL